MQMNRKSCVFFLHSFEFLEVHLVRLGRSPYTIESYRDTLTLFSRFIVEERRKDLATFSFSDCTVDFVFAFLEWLAAMGSADATRNHRLAGLKGYLAYCASKDIALQSIHLKISTIQPYPVAKQEKQILCDKQVALILNQIPETEKGRRNRVLLLLLYETASRVSEIVALKTTNFHLDRDNPYLHVMGKGRKERYIPLVGELVPMLKGYLASLGPGNDDDIVFPSSLNAKNKELSPRSVQAMLQSYADRARATDPTIPIHVHPHMLRRSKATSIYQSGMPIEMVSTLLGHSQVETTRVYAKPSMQQIRRAIESIVPPDGLRQEPLWKGKEATFMKSLGLR